MFDTVDTRKTASLMPVIDALNRDIGKDSIVLGSRLKVSQWQSSKELKSPSYTTSWSEIKTVKA
jgi:hypothetical protein